jgi:RNA polymerase sigma-70 factor (ECF subfamily)
MSNDALPQDKSSADADIHACMRTGQYREAFDLLLPRYTQRVSRLAFSILRDPHAAEDATQDVFVRVWRALDGYNGSASLSTWIYAITRNTCVSLLRKRRQMVSLDTPVFSEDDDGGGLQLAAPEYDDSAVSSVTQLLGFLSQRQRQAVELFYMQDQSYEQTATRLAMPVGTVKALLHRSRKRLVELTRDAA